MSANPEGATAYWTTGPYCGELRHEPLAPLREGDALVRTLYSGHSRGTENLVHAGNVPARVAKLMEAPHQEGHFPAPVKYGYLSVGVVEAGPGDLVGRTVFCLYPHQDRYVVPVGDLTAVPDGVPPRRAILAGAVETAVNALWEAGPRIGDRVAVVGCGLIGGSVAALLRRFPLERLQAVDRDPSRVELAAALGVPFVLPEDAAEDCDIVFHASATSAGLTRSLEIAGDDGEVIELSWYGSGDVSVPLGADFHARRLALRASQVGQVARPRQARRTTAQRLALALGLLRDPVFDAFLGTPSDFADLPATMDRLAGDTGRAPAGPSGASPGLCHLIRYPGAP
ncbi:dehydrogenase [Sinomonas cyclohexanicum]|uniref:Dehydrogenase n=1 Tax=Sinomonas cyclohexanicum TaxID=322009 RepID=A0ABN6FC33_SINCY|nr:zinc-binding alcohol dehydrogenase [Corynebacterium cyclohexanicum]BCT74313.1 dehydrogenase [Corynebacterium cyclohexanicum]